jgi:L-amino acid N-acyltransferase YncA
VTDYRVRAATAADADAICRIYNQGIEDRIATLETELRTPEELARTHGFREAPLAAPALSSDDRAGSPVSTRAA